jgi:heme/copper-type cytochrome/quinol oxidase subunit 3
MQINFNFDTNDWVQFQRHHQRHSTKGLIQYITLILLVVFFIGGGINDFTTGNFPSNCLPIMIMIIIWVIIMRSSTGKWAAKGLEKKEKNNSQVFGKRTMTFDEAFFMVQTDNIESKLTWNAIKKIHETPGYFFLYTSNFMAHVIPKKKIDIESQDLQNFLKKQIVQENYTFYKR